MHLFGCKFCDKSDSGDDDDTECDRKNFDTLLWSVVTCFQVCVSGEIAKLNNFPKTNLHTHIQMHTHTQHTERTQFIKIHAFIHDNKCAEINLSSANIGQHISDTKACFMYYNYHPSTVHKDNRFSC